MLKENNAISKNEKELLKLFAEIDKLLKFLVIDDSDDFMQLIVIYLKKISI